MTTTDPTSRRPSPKSPVRAPALPRMLSVAPARTGTCSVATRRMVMEVELVRMTVPANPRACGTLSTVAAVRRRVVVVALQPPLLLRLLLPPRRPLHHLASAPPIRAEHRPTSTTSLVISTTLGPCPPHHRRLVVAVVIVVVVPVAAVAGEDAPTEEDLPREEQLQQQDRHRHLVVPTDATNVRVTTTTKNKTVTATLVPAAVVVTKMTSRTIKAVVWMTTTMVPWVGSTTTAMMMAPTRRMLEWMPERKTIVLPRGSARPMRTMPMMVLVMANGFPLTMPTSLPLTTRTEEDTKTAMMMPWTLIRMITTSPTRTLPKPHPLPVDDSPVPSSAKCRHLSRLRSRRSRLSRPPAPRSSRPWPPPPRMARAGPRALPPVGLPPLRPALSIRRRPRSVPMLLPPRVRAINPMK
mmetsp:Transcript_3952/g.9040  ORF Transcript_3952/g.9040 Transcript_3952/m.9040 type:complete len:410 (-) Transcript_3952:199-1428(-)